jgi:hypothetical protein
MGAARHTGRRAVATILSAVAVIALAACGNPSRVRTLDGEPDLVRVLGTVPRGFSPSVTEELERLLAACREIDAIVESRVPGAGHLVLTDGHCQWAGAAPELIIGILANPDGGAVLDQTNMVLKDERTVAGVGDRAAFDPETRALYLVRNGRLWYLQLVGSAPGVGASAILASLGRALAQTRAATR